MERFHYPGSNDDSDDARDLDALLHPSQAFKHPSEVVNDPDLTLNEKRAILASWASDACAAAVTFPSRVAQRVGALPRLGLRIG
jgi:hypothetical protein